MSSLAVLTATARWRSAAAAVIATVPARAASAASAAGTPAAGAPRAAAAASGTATTTASAAGYRRAEVDVADDAAMLGRGVAIGRDGRERTHEAVSLEGVVAGRRGVEAAGKLEVLSE